MIETKTYFITATKNIVFDQDFIVDSCNDNGVYTREKDAQTIRVTFLSGMRFVFEKILERDDNVIKFEELAR